MKIRIGFVSNSSSSSFVCDICGENVSGMDMCLREAEMIQCENEHTLCKEHLKIDIENREIIEKFLENRDTEHSKEILGKVKGMTKEEFEIWSENDNYDVISEMLYELPVEFCPICNMNIVIKSDLVRYLMKIYKITKQEFLDIIKKENKRRKKVYDDEYIKYVYENKNVKDVDKDIINKFKSYDEFEKFLLID